MRLRGKVAAVIRMSKSKPWLVDAALSFSNPFTLSNKDRCQLFKWRSNYRKLFIDI